MDVKELALKKHYEWAGKLEISARCAASNREELSLCYTPGVAEPCLAIAADRDLSFELTRRWNTVAVVTDGTAVLGLGDIGPEAGMPVMEGKCVLFKEYGGVDAIPLCIRSKDVVEIVNTVRLLAGSFGGVNLEDIAAPRCFEIERRLKECCDIPIFHDDQHGTAVVCAAAAINAAKVTGRKIEDMRAVVLGAGAAGNAIARQFVSLGMGEVRVVDKSGLLCEDDLKLDSAQAELAKITNKARLKGGLSEALTGADLLVGVAAPGIVAKEQIALMAKDAIVFAMSNPVPEIDPKLAEAAGAAVVGTGRSDFKNQINNVLAFPGIFRGALDVRASDITEEMKCAAAAAIAALVPENELSRDNIMPTPFDKRVAPAVAAAVAAAARKCGVARG